MKNRKNDGNHVCGGVLLSLLPLFLASALATEEQGRDALATAGVLQEPTVLIAEPVKPAITIERQGRLLVLKYGAPSAVGQQLASASRDGEPPTLAIYKGQRQIASGQFQYG